MKWPLGKPGAISAYAVQIPEPCVCSVLNMKTQLRQAPLKTTTKRISVHLQHINQMHKQYSPRRYVWCLSLMGRSVTACALADHPGWTGRQVLSLINGVPGSSRTNLTDLRYRKLWLSSCGRLCQPGKHSTCQPKQPHRRTQKACV